MQSNKNFAIGVLSVTATILLVGLVLIHAQAPRAHAAAGAGIQSGDYMLVNGQFKADEELFYLIDAASEKLVVYRFDTRSRQAFGPTQSIDLSTLRQGVSPGAQPPKPRGGYNRP